MKILNSGNRLHRIIHFEWYLVDFCNYKCSYCNAINKNVDQFSKQTSPSKYKLVLQRLKMLNTPFEVDLYGGEPTLHPEILSILDELSKMDNCKLVEIKTNLSKPLYFLKKLLIHDKIKLAASYHAEYYNQEFLKKCIALKDYNFYCHVNLSDKKEHWPTILNLLNQLDEEKVRYDLNVLLSTPEYDVQYDEEFSNTFNQKLKNISDKTKYRFEFINGEIRDITSYEAYSNNLVRFNGYKCQALLYDIDSDGTIVNACTGEKMPYIVKDNIFVNNVVCPKQTCHADIMLKFFKENQSV